MCALNIYTPDAESPRQYGECYGVQQGVSLYLITWMYKGMQCYQDVIDWQEGMQNVEGFIYNGKMDSTFTYL